MHIQAEIQVSTSVEINCKKLHIYYCRGLHLISRTMMDYPGCDEIDTFIVLHNVILYPYTNIKYQQ